MKYIYIDESGDLGSKKSSSRYFVLAGIMVSKPKKLDNPIKNTYRKHKNIRDMNEIKGTTTPENVKKDILSFKNPCIPVADSFLFLYFFLFFIYFFFNF